MAQNNEHQPASAEDAVVIDLGKKKRKDVKRLRKGEGKILDEVQFCLEELRETGAIEGLARPVIVVVREKAKRRRWF